MNRRLDRTMRRWLRYERAGDDRRAERELHRLMTALPPAAVPHGFADRVLAASGVAVARASKGAIRPWIWRAVFAFWLVSGFLVAALAAGFAVDLVRSGQWVVLGSRLAVGLSRFGTDMLTALGGLWRAAHAVSVAFSSPAMLLLVLSCALAGSLAFGALSSVMASDRSPRHA